MVDASMKDHPSQEIQFSYTQTVGGSDVNIMISNKSADCGPKFS
jgi:hypothetical protein